MSIKTRVHLLTEALLAIALAATLLAWHIRGKGTVANGLRLALTETGQAPIPPFGAFQGVTTEGERYLEEQDRNEPVLKIQRMVIPDIDRPPPPDWLAQKGWEGAVARPVFQIRETRHDIYVSMTTMERDPARFSFGLKGQVLRIEREGAGKPLFLLLPTSLAPDSSPVAELTNGVLRIKVAKAFASDS